VKIPVSDTLKNALVREGSWKIAAEVRRRAGGVAPTDPTLENFAVARGFKAAADHSDEDVIDEGLEAYRRILEAP